MVYKKIIKLFNKFKQWQLPSGNPNESLFHKKKMINGIYEHSESGLIDIRILNVQLTTEGSTFT